VKMVQKRLNEWADFARERISEEEAKELIIARLQKKMANYFEAYLNRYQRDFVLSLEKIHDKYALTLQQIRTTIDEKKLGLDMFLKELGYE
jgi:type I restriction enzyme M protein